MEETSFIIEAYKRINEIHGKKKPKKPIVDTIKCPKCNGILHFSKSSYNGHIWGKCETEDCLSWMQ
jgi:hypothetical protein